MNAIVRSTESRVKPPLYALNIWLRSPAVNSIVALILDGNSDIGAHVRPFVLFKAFDWIENSDKLYFFSAKRPIYLHACTTCSELPSEISTMGSIV